MRKLSASSRQSHPNRPGQPARRSPCPVAATLDLIGDKWTLLVIRDLFAGKSRFRDLVALLEGIATNILVNRLHRLREAALVEVKSSPQRTCSLEYYLTERGRSLLPILIVLRDWGLANEPGTKATLQVKN